MATIMTDKLWNPPEKMPYPVRVAWLAFYSRAMDNYGVTPEQYNFLYRIQKGRCWICRKAKGINPEDPMGRGGRRLGIDHNHVTGQVRGLLCTGGDKTCNRIIGWLTAPALIRAADYLEGNCPGVWLRGTPDEARAMEILWMDDPDA